MGNVDWIGNVSEKLTHPGWVCRLSVSACSQIHYQGEDENDGEGFVQAIDPQVPTATNSWHSKHDYYQ